MLFRLSLQPDGRVEELGRWEGSVWVWNLRWRRPLFVWEADLLNQLLLVVVRNTCVARGDAWSWRFSSDGLFSFKSAYSFLLPRLPASSAPVGENLQAVSQVWTSGDPSKVIVFSWQLILDRIPTRFNLLRRGVPLPEGGLGCAFCEAPTESSVHLFLECPSIFQCGIRSLGGWVGILFCL